MARMIENPCNSGLSWELRADIANEVISYFDGNYMHVSGTMAEKLLLFIREYYEYNMDIDIYPSLCSDELFCIDCNEYDETISVDYSPRGARDNSAEFMKAMERTLRADQYDFLAKYIGWETKPEFAAKTTIGIDGNIHHTLEKVETTESKTENKEETTMEMKKIFGNVEFGKVTDGNFKISHLGVAIKTADGKYVAYDKEKKQLVDVDIVSVDGKNFLYKMPVAVSDIKPGDVIINGTARLFVTATNPLKTVNMIGAETECKIMTNMFGFNFVTKIVSLLDMCNPTGAGAAMNNMMLPLMLMNGDKDSDLMPLIMMNMMNSNPATSGMNIFNNPMMMLALADSKNDMLPLMLMMNPAMFGNANHANAQTASPTAE